MIRYVGSVSGSNGLNTVHNIMVVDAITPEEALGKMQMEAKRLGYGNFPHVASVIGVENIINAKTLQEIIEYRFE